MIVSPLRATWKRWKRFCGNRYSLLRSLEYERIEGLLLRGRTLDLGGGQRADYLRLLRIEGAILSVNISPAMCPTVVANLNDPLPFASGAFDNIISLNTLEHIKEDVVAVREAVRVLRPGGSFHIIVPFLFHVHASPYDYHRHSAPWWQDFLQSLGLASEDFSIEPLVWDPISSAFSLVEFDRFLRFGKRPVLLRAVLSHARWPLRERLPAKLGEAYAEYAVGYYIHGTRPCTH